MKSLRQNDKNRRANLEKSGGKDWKKNLKNVLQSDAKSTFNVTYRYMLYKAEDFR